MFTFSISLKILEFMWPFSCDQVKNFLTIGIEKKKRFLLYWLFRKMNVHNLKMEHSKVHILSHETSFPLIIDDSLQTSHRNAWWVTKNASFSVEIKIHNYVMCKHETSCVELFVNVKLKKFLYSNFSEY